jgi:hypothetical protein
MESRPITPYQAPLLLEEGNNIEQQPLLSSIRHVAIASKSYRVFGLDDVAWQTARDDLRRYTASVGGHGSDNVEGNDGNENRKNSQEEEEQSELLEICTAIYTALQIDAGGYGTAGFHLVSLYIFLWHTYVQLRIRYIQYPIAHHLSLNTIYTGKSTKCTTNQNIQQFSHLYSYITSTCSLSKI